MADINYQTDQIFDEKSAQQKIADDEYYAGLQSFFERDPIVKEPLSLEERTNQVIDQGSYDQDLRNKFIGEITVNMFGDPTGGLKYPDGTDDDRTFETNRLKGMNVSQLFDEYQYWNSELQKVTDLEENDMNVKDWFSKMFKKFGVKEEPKEKETELLKGSNYYPPQQ